MTDPNLPVNTSVVINKCEPGRGHTLFLDNWYSSPDLFRRLTERKTNVIETVGVKEVKVFGLAVQKVCIVLLFI